MTIFQNIAFGLKGIIAKSAIPERVEHVMQLVKMQGYEKRKPVNYRVDSSSGWH